MTELFERGFRRTRQAPLSIIGESCRDAENNTVTFSLEVAEGRIAAVGFRASCCATLIAYCEYIAEIVSGFRVAIAQGLTTQNLLDGLPGVPACKRDRAVLAIAGFRSALVAADAVQRGESDHESRLYLCHPAP